VPAGQPVRLIELIEPGYRYEATQALADLAGGPVLIRVAQLGTGVASRTAALTLQP
jgi:hypothetical protein